MRALIAPLVLFVAASAAAQEKLSLTNVDVRTGITFKVSDDVARKMLPAGWELNSPASGPSQGANLTVTLLEQVVQQDAQGNPLSAVQGVAIGVPARRASGDGAGNMIVAGLFTGDGAPGAYGMYLPAKGVVERKQRIDGDGKVLIEEHWSFANPGGDSLDVKLQFTRGAAVRGKTESKVYSAGKPDFYRIYRVDQVTDLIRGNGVDRIVSIAVKGAGPKLGAIFNGSEKIVSVTSVPSYSRQVFLPGP